MFFLGYLIYLKGHEGRGIGLGNKIAAYALQEQGHNTYEANEKLGLPKDNRNYVEAILMLKSQEIDHFDFISNNPEKIKAREEAGFTFDVLQSPVMTNEMNQQYLFDKIKLGNHNLKLI